MYPPCQLHYVTIVTNHSAPIILLIIQFAGTKGAGEKLCPFPATKGGRKMGTLLHPSSKIPKLDLKIQIKCPPKPRSGHLPMKRRDIKSKLVVCPKACQRFITPARSLEGHIWRA